MKVLVLRRVLGHPTRLGPFSGRIKIDFVGPRGVRGIHSIPAAPRSLVCPFLKPRHHALLSMDEERATCLCTSQCYLWHSTGEGASVLVLEVGTCVSHSNRNYTLYQLQVTATSPTKGISSRQTSLWTSINSIILFRHICPRSHAETCSPQQSQHPHPPSDPWKAADDVRMTSRPQQPMLPALACQPAVHPCETIASGWQP